MKWLPFSFLLIGALWLSSCGPKPITGQVFIVTPAGNNISLQNVEIDVINGSEADAYIVKTESEIRQASTALKAQINQLEAQLREAKTNRDIAQKNFTQTKQSFDNFIERRAYTNNPNYAALKIKLDAIIGGKPVDPTRVGKETTPEGGGAGPDSVEKLQGQLNKLVIWIEEPFRKELAQKKATFEKASEKYSALLPQMKSRQEELRGLQAPEAYLGSYSPAVIEKTTADSNGNFLLHNSQPSAKVFAKAQRQSSESTEKYFWLVDMPVNGEKLILSNTNLFTVPNLN